MNDLRQDLDQTERDALAAVNAERTSLVARFLGNPYLVLGAVIVAVAVIAFIARMV